MEIYVDDEAKLTLHGLVQHYVMLQEDEKNRKLTDLLDALDFNQVGEGGGRRGRGGNLSFDMLRRGIAMYGMLRTCELWMVLIPWLWCRCRRVGFADPRALRAALRRLLPSRSGMSIGKLVQPSVASDHQGTRI
jgi:hypothetical protein